MKVEFASRTRRMLIDSGAATSSLVVRRLDKYQTVTEPRVVGISAGLRSSDIELRSAARAARPILLGPHALQAAMLTSTEDTELIGGDLMQHFTWTFDQATKRFQMTRNDPDAEIDFAPLSGLGLIYSPTVEGLLIRTILEDAPAQQFDIKPGDLVTRINDQPLIHHDQPLIHRGCKTSDEDTRTIGFLRDGQFRQVTLELYSVVP